MGKRGGVGLKAAQEAAQHDVFAPVMQGRVPMDYFGIRVTGHGGSYGCIRRIPGTNGPQVVVDEVGLDPRASVGASDTQKGAFVQATALVREGKRQEALMVLCHRRAFGADVAVFHVIATERVWN
jgi:hypothetical protein